jgi:hypothetical protein
VLKQLGHIESITPFGFVGGIHKIGFWLDSNLKITQPAINLLGYSRI